MNGLIHDSSASHKLGGTAQVSLLPDLSGCTKAQQFLVPGSLRAGVLLPARLFPFLPARGGAGWNGGGNKDQRAVPCALKKL